MTSWRPQLVAGGAIGAAAAFVVLLGVAPARFMGVDDAYYLGIGANIFSGRGPFTAFGTFAGHHAPLWSIAITAPHAWFSIDAPSWAHFLVVISGASVILLTAWFAWRAVRVAAVIAAAAMLGFPFMIGLGAGLGLDLPAAALALGYMAVGLVAVRRGSILLGAVAGLVFATAFLTKEIALPFAPVPLLAGLVRGAPLRGLVQASAASLLVATVATSWWFIVYAERVGTVYRIGTPWWTLIPMGMVAVVGGILGLMGGRWLPPPGSPPTSGARRRGLRLGWLGAAAWAALLTVMFARTPTGLGTSFLVPEQVAGTLGRWYPALGSVLAVGLVGGAYEVTRRLFGTRAQGAPSNSHAIDDLLIATICGFPLVLLVISVGEGPRHYIAQLAVLVALGACGWVRIAERSLQGDGAGVLLGIVALGAGFTLALPTLIPLASPRFVLPLAVLAGLILVIVAVIVFGIRAGLISRSRSSRDAMAAVALSALLGAAVVVTFVVVPVRQNSIDRARSEAVRTIVAWVRADMPAGSPIVLSDGLGFELALHLQATYRTSQIRDEAGIHVESGAPSGVAKAGEPGVDDWVALRASPTDITSMYGYRSSTIVALLREIGPTTWIQWEVTGVNQVNPIVHALTGAPGATVAARWDWPYGVGRLEMIAFRVDPAKLEFPDRLFVTTQALDRIVVGLESGGIASRGSAANLLATVQVAGPDPAGAALLDRLARLAGP